jgi:hypothetical protein
VAILTVTVWDARGRVLGDTVKLEASAIDTITKALADTKAVIVSRALGQAILFRKATAEHQQHHPNGKSGQHYFILVMLSPTPMFNPRFRGASQMTL